MTPEHLEALSALFDGEEVDPAVLAEAFADPEAAEVLADFAGLGVLARADQVEPSGAFYARMEPLLSRQGLRDRMTRFFLPALAASLMLVAATTGYLVGLLRSRPTVITIEQAAAPFQPAAALGAVPPPVLGPAASPRRTVRAQPSAPPPSALRLRFLRWEDRAVGLGQPPE